jgi:hypothetical protein
MSQRQIDDVIERVKAKSQRTYKEEVGNVNR